MKLRPISQARKDNIVVLVGLRNQNGLYPASWNPVREEWMVCNSTVRFNDADLEGWIPITQEGVETDDEIHQATFFKQDVERLLVRYGTLSAYQTIGALEAVKQNILDRLKEQ